MSGIKNFITESFAYKTIITKAASYTVLTSDDVVQVNGAYTMTLPPLNSLSSTITKKKAYKFTNVHATADATIQPGTNTITGTADTIGGKATFTLKPNESIQIAGTETMIDWAIVDPYPTPALTRVPFCVSVTVASSASATPTNIFDANGAPQNIDITEVIMNATDTVAANICVLNGTSTVCTIAKGTVTATLTPAGTISTPAVAKGAVLAVFASASGYGRVTIIGTTQTII